MRTETAVVSCLTVLNKDLKLDCAWQQIIPRKLMPEQCSDCRRIIGELFSTAVMAFPV
jgi:hypothetical protein